MTRTIRKYKLKIDATLTLPPGKPVLVVIQDDSHAPTIWIEHTDQDLDSPGASVIYRLAGTGLPFEGTATHVGACICGPLVWHVYREQP